MSALPKTAVLPIPGRCIWCREELLPSDREKADESHVLHASLGNADHVLPRGIVCGPCNGYFGAKVDPALIEFPPIHMTAALLEMMNTRRNKLFRDSVPRIGRIPDTPGEIIDIGIGVESARLVLDLRRRIIGRCEKTFRPKDLRILSRAVYKLLMESIALQVYVLGHPEPVDLFASDFEHACTTVGTSGRTVGSGTPMALAVPRAGFTSELADRTVVSRARSGVRQAACVRQLVFGGCDERRPQRALESVGESAGVRHLSIFRFHRAYRAPAHSQRNWVGVGAGVALG